MEGPEVDGRNFYSTKKCGLGLVWSLAQEGMRGFVDEIDGLTEVRVKVDTFASLVRIR